MLTSKSLFPPSKGIFRAYNAAKTLQKTYEDIPKDFVSNIILVDDVSQDQTVDVARSLGLSVVIHIQHRGYGETGKPPLWRRSSSAPISS